MKNKEFSIMNNGCFCLDKQQSCLCFKPEALLGIFDAFYPVVQYQLNLRRRGFVAWRCSPFTLKLDEIYCVLSHHFENVMIRDWVGW